MNIRKLGERLKACARAVLVAPVTLILGILLIPVIFACRVISAYTKQLEEDCAKDS